MLTLGSGGKVGSHLQSYRQPGTYLAHASAPQGREGHNHASTSARAMLAARCRLNAHAATAATHDEQPTCDADNADQVGRRKCVH